MRERICDSSVEPVGCEVDSFKGEMLHEKLFGKPLC